MILILSYYHDGISDIITIPCYQHSIYLFCAVRDTFYKWSLNFVQQKQCFRCMLILTDVVYCLFHVRSVPSVYKTEECICRFGRQTCCERSTSTSYWVQTVREIFKNTRYFKRETCSCVDLHCCQNGSQRSAIRVSVFVPVHIAVTLYAPVSIPWVPNKQRCRRNPQNTLQAFKGR